MSHCELLIGKTLQGTRRPGNWTITAKFPRRPGGTGGTFSIGYVALHEDGTEAFCKATDIGLLTRGSSADPLTRMMQALNEQQFERQILEICRGHSMDRIVHALDYGQIEMEQEGIRDVVFYIMFEMAKGDVRQQISRQQRMGLTWTLHALHNLTNAIQQLHIKKITHNDVKPSNFLIFEEYLQKLADLGRATAEDTSGPWDKVHYAGDRAYAAPEFWYQNTFPQQNGKVLFSVRQASDLYHLGNMAFFLVTGERLSTLMFSFMRPEHSPINWKGTFQEVLPFVRDALGQSITYFDKELPTDSAGVFIPEALSLRTAVTQLCEPDPSKRGHPQNIASGGDVYGLQRYISQFDAHAKTIRLRQNA